MQPFPVSVAEILHEHGASEMVDADVELERFAVGEQTFTATKPAHVSVTLTNTGSGVVAAGVITADLQASCSRCLCEFELPVSGEVEGFYVEDRYAHEIPEETEAEPIGGDAMVDLAPVLMGAIAVEIPFAPVHDPECAGLCPTCGADLNEGPCECHEAHDDAHPFAALQTLFEGEGGVASDSETTAPTDGVERS